MAIKSKGKIKTDFAGKFPERLPQMPDSMLGTPEGRSYAVAMDSWYNDHKKVLESTIQSLLDKIEALNVS